MTGAAVGLLYGGGVQAEPVAARCPHIPHLETVSQAGKAQQTVRASLCNAAHQLPDNFSGDDLLTGTLTDEGEIVWICWLETKQEELD